MKRSMKRRPPEWAAWAAAVAGWACGILVWANGGPESQAISTVAAVLVVVAAIVVAAIAVLRRSTALGVLALLTLVSPVIVLAASFATWR
ncbi:hypothetical protein [Corynebacterium sp.]|uniref:hypothetical protein n=1 Tax=Corynebacterium sp. TaxID=1720 RepID=UPI0026DB0AEC|nr:hypothetical protein [Corynebacterium sp.]MDO4609416.1 hypothetical protein [Corynebacterium sp.]